MKGLHEQWGQSGKGCSGNTGPWRGSAWVMGVEVCTGGGGPWKWLQGRGVAEPAERICRSGRFGARDGDIGEGFAEMIGVLGDHREGRWCTASIRRMSVGQWDLGMMGWSVGRSVQAAQETYKLITPAR